MEKRKYLKKILIALAMVICLTACSGRGTDTSGAEALPEEVMEKTMTSLKELNLETFNDCTDNYVATHRNWIGIPVRREYRVFNELMQPGIKGGKQYKWNKEMAEKIIENLSWEIEEVRENGDEAQIDIIITNKDLTDVTGIYELNLIKGMIGSEGIGMKHLFGEISDLVNSGGELIPIIEQMNQTCSISVTVQAKKEAGKWRIHLAEDFIDAFMGNLGSGEYSEEIERQLNDLYSEFDRKADKIGEDIERWAEGLFE